MTRNFVKGNTQFVPGVPDNIVGEINCRMEICKFLPCYHSIPDRRAMMVLRKRTEGGGDQFSFPEHYFYNTSSRFRSEAPFRNYGSF